MGFLDTIMQQQIYFIISRQGLVVAKVLMLQGGNTAPLKSSMEEEANESTQVLECAQKVDDAVLNATGTLGQPALSSMGNGFPVFIQEQTS